MKATLSYRYLGERFPDLNDTVVIVKEMADRAEIPYVLLKNRMNMKAKRTMSLRSVWISDSDLKPKKRNRKVKKITREDEIQQYNDNWLKRSLL